jgi:hypothetical protein
MGRRTGAWGSKGRRSGDGRSPRHGRTRTRPESGWRGTKIYFRNTRLKLDEWKGKRESGVGVAARPRRVKDKQRLGN